MYLGSLEKWRVVDKKILLPVYLYRKISADWSRINHWKIEWPQWLKLCRRLKLFQHDFFIKMIKKIKATVFQNHQVSVLRVETKKPPS